MKRRYRRKPKRTFKRTKRFRKRSYSKRKKYDGIVKRKIVQVYQLNTTNASPNVGYYCVNWSNHNTAAATSTCTFTGQREFRYYMDLHKEMSVRGCKIKFMPYSNFSGNANISTVSVEMYSRTRELPNAAMGVAEVHASVDYKTSAYKFMQKYITVERYNKKNGNWWVAPVAQAGGDYHVTGYQDAGTIVRVITNGFTTATPVGTLEVTWYLKFKTDKILGADI